MCSSSKRRKGVKNRCDSSFRCQRATTKNPPSIKTRCMGSKAVIQKGRGGGGGEYERNVFVKLCFPHNLHHSEGALVWGKKTRRSWRSGTWEDQGKAPPSLLRLQPKSPEAWGVSRLTRGRASIAKNIVPVRAERKKATANEFICAG